MKIFARKWLVVSVGVLTLVMGFQNCGRMQSMGFKDLNSISGGGGGGGGGGIDNSPEAAGSGSKYSGVGPMAVPTADGVVARVSNALQISPTAGNFAKSLASVKSNLPRTTDPSKAAGFDQIQLLVYAACSDLTTGGTASAMQKKYLVPATGTVAANKAALVAAGVQMFDTYVAGMASQGPTAAQVSDALSKLVDTVGATSTNTSTIAFVSVCIAANTAGSTLLGF